MVTGASSGIGRATALCVRRAGFSVYATARKVQALEDLEGTIACCWASGVWRALRARRSGVWAFLHLACALACARNLKPL